MQLVSKTPRMWETMAKRVFIGVGHGGPDPGAIANGLQEKDVALVTALKCREVLEAAGVVVGISRIKDEEDRLAEEISEANAFKPDIAIEIHYNAGGGDGFEVYTQTNTYKAKSTALAKVIEAQVKAIGQNSRGVRTKLNANGTDYFGWLRQVKCPAVLLEGAFIDSKDHTIVDTVKEQEAFGVAYAKGVLEYLGVKEPQNGDLYRVQVGAFKNKANADAMVKRLKALGYAAYITK